MLFDTNGKNCSSVLILIYRRCSNSLFMTLYQPLSNLHWHFPWCKYLAVTQVNTKKDARNKNWPKKNCVWLEKYIAQPRVIAQTCG